MKKLLVILCAMVLLIGIVGKANTILIVSLAGDKDIFGTGLPLGSPVIPDNMVNDLQDGDFDQRRASSMQWQHVYTLPSNELVTRATLTMLTIDIEDAGVGDWQGGGPFNLRLFLDALEVLGAFDNVFTSDLTSADPLPPNLVVFTLGTQFFFLFGDGLVNANMADLQGGDNYWVDYAELQIVTTTSDSIPEPATIALLGIGLVGLADGAAR